MNIWLLKLFSHLTFSIQPVWVMAQWTRSKYAQMRIWVVGSTRMLSVEEETDASKKIAALFPPDGWFDFSVYGDFTFEPLAPESQQETLAQFIKIGLPEISGGLMRPGVLASIGKPNPKSEISNYLLKNFIGWWEMSLNRSFWFYIVRLCLPQRRSVRQLSPEWWDQRWRKGGMLCHDGVSLRNQLHPISQSWFDGSGGNGDQIAKEVISCNFGIGTNNYNTPLTYFWPTSSWPNVAGGPTLGVPWRSESLRLVYRHFLVSDGIYYRRAGRSGKLGLKAEITPKL